MNNQIIDMRDCGADSAEHSDYKEENRKAAKRIAKEAGKIFGEPSVVQISRRKSRKPMFTANADSPEQAERLLTLAEQAFSAKGYVFAKRGKDKNCVCWAIITVIEDGMIGKKVQRHYELTALEAAAGHEDDLPALEEEVIRILRDQMLLSNRVQKAQIGGTVFTQKEVEQDVKTVKLNSPNFWIAVSLALCMGMLTKNFGLAILYYLMFSNLDFTGEKSRNKQNAKETETDHKENLS